MVMPTHKPLNAVPRFWSKGTKDESTRPQIYTSQPLPIHTPLWFTFSSRGPYEGRFCYGSDVIEYFGKEVTDGRSEYSTIVTPFIDLCREFGNPMLIQRVFPKDATPEAAICLALEVVKTTKLKAKQRRLDGKYEIGSNNMTIDTGEELSGYVVRWKAIRVNSKDDLESPVNAKRELGALGRVTGDLVYDNDPDAESIIYPILEFKAQWIGSYGNNVGIQLLCQTDKGDRRTASQKLITDQRALPYEIRVFTRENEFSLPTLVRTIEDLPGARVSFKEGAYDPDAGDASVDFEDVFLDNYRDLTPGRAPKYGDIGEVYVYRENLEELLGLFMTAEKAAGNSNLDIVKDIGEDIHLFNFVTGLDLRGAPYRAVMYLNTLDGARETLGNMSVTFLKDGFDGTMSNKIYDELVREQMDHFGDMITKFRDLGRYPFHQIYDPGFTLETKMSLFNALGVRHDSHVTVSTYDMVTGRLRNGSMAEEGQIAFQLLSYARNFMESEEFGTPVCRAEIVPQAGKLIYNPQYRKYVPATYERLAQRAEYMSSPLGMATGRGYDAPPYNHVRRLKEMTNVWAPESVYEKNWMNGLSYFMHKTQDLMFLPAARSVYRDDTSVLTSDITVQAICDIHLICFRVWTNLVGNTKLTDAEFMALSDRMISEAVVGRYDGRFQIVPHTYKTREDQNNGYSWTCEVHLYANNMRTVNNAFVVTHRMEDLTNG